MEYKRVRYEDLKIFCEKVFAGFDFTEEESRIITDVLLAADLAGIESHGVQRLVRYYKEVGELHYVDRNAICEVVKETPVSAVVDGHNGMGQLIGVKAMELAIDKAQKTGIGMVCVRDSNHFGIAGYYVRMAIEKGLAGIAMTNTEAIMVPTFGKKAMLGTNPIAFGMPADPVPFLFDAATTVVPRGKLEVYAKKDGRIREGWAVDETGSPCGDADRVLHNIITKSGGGILPLGGAGEETSGYKGYGFGMLCEIFTAILAGGTTSDRVYKTGHGSGIAHFFAAFDPALFGDPQDLRASLSALMEEIRTSPKADGQERIYTHGEKEALARERVLAEGVPVQDRTFEEMKMIAGATHTEAFLPQLL